MSTEDDLDAQLDAQLKAAQQKLIDIGTQESLLLQQKREIEKEIQDIKFKQIEGRTMFTINCQPMDGKHVRHTTGLFSSAARAQHCLPKHNTSFDSDDHCTWTYSVIEADADTTKSRIKKLDKYPDNFPYTGW